LIANSPPQPSFGVAEAPVDDDFIYTLFEEDPDTTSNNVSSSSDTTAVVHSSPFNSPQHEQFDFFYNTPRPNNSNQDSTQYSSEPTIQAPPTQNDSIINSQGYTDYIFVNNSFDNYGNLTDQESSVTKSIPASSSSMAPARFSINENVREMLHPDFSRYWLSVSNIVDILFDNNVQ